jgi:hypothetical protein
MPKKKPKKKQKQSKEAGFINILIEYTERNIKNDGSDLDQVFIGQSKKLRKQLSELK